MKVKKAVRKIVALGAGTLMLGATLFGATAANLEEYPNQFIDLGSFDGKIVVGANAASQDIIGAIDIAASLQAASTTDVPSSTGSTTVIEGDSKQIGDNSDILEIGEQLGVVTETITGGDLMMLEGGRVTTSKGSTDFTQILELDESSLTGGGTFSNSDHMTVLLDENNDDETGNFLFFNDGDPFFTYELEFTSGLESDVDSNDDAEDLEDESIFMLGQFYSIVNSDVDDASNSTVLELIAGDVVDTLSEGQTRTYTGDGVDYEVTVLVVGSSSGSTNEVKFLVNGEVTDSMEDGDTDTLSDGLEIGVREIIQRSAQFEGDTASIVEFYLGANKVEFDDSDTQSSTNGGSVEINRENIEDATVEISAVITSSDIRINSFTYTLDVDSADQTDVYLGPGEGIRAHLDEPEGMLGDMWDFVYVGLSDEPTSVLEFTAQGDDEYRLTFENRRGDIFSVDYAAFQGGSAAFGDEDDDFTFFEDASAGSGSNTTPIVDGHYLISLDGFFAITDVGGTGLADNGDDSYVLRFSDVDEDDGTVSFEHAGSGEEIVATYSPVGAVGDTPASPVTGDITIGGKDFTFWLFEDATNSYQLAVDLDNDGVYGDGAEGTDIVDIVIRGGGILTPSNDTVAADGWFATLRTLDEDLDSDVEQIANITFTLPSATTLEVDIPSGATGTSGTWYHQNVQDEDREEALNAYGTMFSKTDDSQDSDSLVIHYPLSQREAVVVVTGGDVQTSMVGGSSGAQRINVLPVGLAVLDTEIDLGDDNMIVVGGPCANSIAAALLGNPADCTEGFQPGMGMINLWDGADNPALGGNVAMLVAGFSAGDTVASSQLVARAATEMIPNFEGSSVEVVIAGANDVTVRSAMSDMP